VMVLASLAAHNASQGRSSFDLDDDGTMRIEIQISEVDLPELCNVDFAVHDRVKQERNLEGCLRGGLPFWVRIRADERECKVEYLAWRELEPRTLPPVLAINALAKCDEVPSQLGIDWGLFVGSPLDHTSVAKIEAPHVDPRVFAFSKRARKLDISLTPHWLVGAEIAGAAVAVLALGVGVALLARKLMRARRRGPA
jgi:hypothetical protein